MSLYLQAVLIACAVGAGGTAIGASGALAVHAPKKTLSAILLGLAGGVILALMIHRQK